MACECEHNRERIEQGYADIAKLRAMFIKRMTEDSETQDKRRKDYYQAIFSYEMVLKCFDDAVKDWRKSWCDVEDCKRPGIP